MIARAVAVALVALGVSGCLAAARIDRMNVDLAENVRQGREAQAMRAEERILNLTVEAYGEASPEAVQVRTRLAESWARWNHIDRALALANSTVDIVERDYGANDERIAIALESLAKVHYLAQRRGDAERVLDRASKICRSVLTRAQSPAEPLGDCRVQVHGDLPDYYLAIGAHRKWADEYLFINTHNLRNPFRHDREGGISMLTVLGRGHAENGAYPEAAWYLQRCVDELRPRYAAPVPSERTAWSDARHDVEVVILDAAHSFHSQSPRCLEDLIEIRHRLGQDGESNALATWQRELWARGPDLEAQLVEDVRFADYAWHADFLTSSRANNLAFYYLGKGRHEDARLAYEQAVGYIDRAVARDGVFAGNYPVYLHIDELLGLGLACERTGRFADAQAAYRRATGIADRELHPRHAWRLEGRARAARAAQGAGNRREAVDEWNRYLAIAERIRGREHADFAFGLSGLASAMEADGRHAEAAAARARANATWNEYRRHVEAARDLPLPVSLRSR